MSSSRAAVLAIPSTLAAATARAATPTVGMAYLRAYGATGDRFYLDAARETAEALAYGQLRSGGWTNKIDFNPRGDTAQYRNGKGRGMNNSSLDDGQTQSAIRFLVLADKALGFQHQGIHEPAEYALNALLAAQFPNGGFPQVWTGPVEKHPVVKASYPEYDWRTEGRVKNYWDMYTLNDNVCGHVAETLITAHQVYGDEKSRDALRRLGDFLMLAQMPNPQPAWAQQYNSEMKPIWARKFEPAAISGDRRNHGDHACPLPLAVVPDDGEQRRDAQKVRLELGTRSLERGLACALIGQSAVSDQHRVDSAQALHALVDQALVSGGVVEVDHAGFDPARTANAQIVRDRTELVGVAGGEKQHVMRGSKAAGGLVRDRRGRSTDQYAPWIAHEATRRQKLEEKLGSTYAQKARHSGKYWRKLCADMRASFAG